MGLKRVYRGKLKRHQGYGEFDGTLSIMDDGIQFVSDDDLMGFRDTSKVTDLGDKQLDVEGYGIFHVRSEVPVTAPSMRTAVVRVPVKVGVS